MKKNLLSKDEIKMITKAIGLELGASNAYKYASNECKDLGFFGSAAFFQKENIDETTHYQIWADFVNDMGGCAEVPTVESPESNSTTLQDIFEAYYKREADLLKFYSDWYMNCGNAAIHVKLQKFIKIQTKSVGEAGDYLATLEQCGTDKCALLVFDNPFK